MEGLTRKLGIQDKKLQRLFIIYGIFSAFLLATLIAGRVLSDHARSSNETEKNLEHIRSSLVRIEGATKDIRRSVVTIERTIPLSIFKETPQRQLLSGLDDLKDTMKHASIHVAEIAASDNKLVLPITIRGLITDYSSFVNDIGRLQAMRFPFVNIRGIEIKNEDIDKKAQTTARQKRPDRIVYEISGELLTLLGETGPVPPQQQGTPPPSARLWTKGGPK